MTFQDCSESVSRYLIRSERVFALDLMPSLCLNSSRSVMSVIRPAGGWIDGVDFFRNLHSPKHPSLLRTQNQLE